MRTTLLLLTALSLLATGCSYDDLAAVETDQLALLDGSPEGIGLLAFLNDSATTFVLLDDDVPLDRRAAQGLIDARAVAPLATVAEVDDVSYVGPQALNRLVWFAGEQGWVPAGDDELGTWDGVTFTVDEVAAVIDLVNAASLTELDDTLGLDSRAANSIVAAQPVPSVAHLAGLYYVGGSALGVLLDEAVTPTEPPAEPFEDQFVMDESDDIPDGWGEFVTANSVNGVPDQEVTITLVLDVLHEAPGELSITLTDPNGDTVQVDVTGQSITQTVWTQGSPNGDWILTIEDGVPGFPGELWGWALEVVSVD